MMSQEQGQYLATYSYDPAHPHAVSALEVSGTPFGYSYDANGNMLSGTDFTDPSNPALRTLTWNADNMPVSVSRGGVTTSFKYDGLGQRAKKQVGGATPTYYIGTEYEVISGVGTKYIFAGNLRIAKVSSTGVYYFHKDHLGSSTVMTGDTGAAVEASEYQPYGMFRSQAGTVVSNYKFTDQELDNSSGLYNYDARLYDPVVGRFISPDPTVPRPFDRQSLNRYSYCRNNPLIYVDPSGLEDEGWGGSDGSWGSWDSDADSADEPGYTGDRSDGQFTGERETDYRDAWGNPVAVGRWGKPNPNDNNTKCNPCEEMVDRIRRAVDPINNLLDVKRAMDDTIEALETREEEKNKEIENMRNDAKNALNAGNRGCDEIGGWKEDRINHGEDRIDCYRGEKEKYNKTMRSIDEIENSLSFP